VGSRGKIREFFQAAVRFHFGRVPLTFAATVWISVESARISGWEGCNSQLPGMPFTERNPHMVRTVTRLDELLASTVRCKLAAHQQSRRQGDRIPQSRLRSVFALCRAVAEPRPPTAGTTHRQF
jgi:hypothetical protein